LTFGARFVSRRASQKAPRPEAIPLPVEQQQEPTMTKIHIAASIALAALLALGSADAATAKAYSGEETHSQKVRVSDLDLSTEAGAAQLISRIHRAAERVCGMNSGGHDFALMSSRSYRTCVREAAADAVAKVNSPVVTALHGGKTSLEIASK
jgi:UrcA family protein